MNIYNILTQKGSLYEQQKMIHELSREDLLELLSTEECTNNIAWLCTAIEEYTLRNLYNINVSSQITIWKKKHKIRQALSLGRLGLHKDKKTEISIDMSLFFHDMPHLIDFINQRQLTSSSLFRILHYIQNDDALLDEFLTHYTPSKLAWKHEDKNTNILLSLICYESIEKGIKIYQKFRDKFTCQHGIHKHLDDYFSSKNIVDFMSIVCFRQRILERILYNQNNTTMFNDFYHQYVFLRNNDHTLMKYKQHFCKNVTSGSISNLFSLYILGKCMQKYSEFNSIWRNDIQCHKINLGLDSEDITAILADGCQKNPKGFYVHATSETFMNNFLDVKITKEKEFFNIVDTLFSPMVTHLKEEVTLIY